MIPLLSTPSAGWTEISIGDWHDHASDIFDVPAELLKTMEQAVRLRQPISVMLYAEDHEYILVFDEEHTFVITNAKEDPDQHTFVDLPFGWLNEELPLKMIADIRRDLALWASWGDSGTMSDDQKSERAKDLIVLCEILEKHYHWWFN